MKIKHLKLKNYRNYEFLNVEFDDFTNIFFGNNAQGKTNILEAIYLCGTTKSHRRAKDHELIKIGHDESHIETVVEKNGAAIQIDIHLKRNEPKGIAINKVPIKRAGELFGLTHMIFFAPEDLNIIKNGPAERRRFMDLELSQLDKIYLKNLSDYNKIVSQRNRLLKDYNEKQEIYGILDALDTQLILYGNKIIDRRNIFITQLSEIVKKIHNHLTGGNENISLSYEKSSGFSPLSEAVMKNREKDIHTRNTTIGPHRDDIRFMANGMEIRTYGSQGQKRTAALSLKLAEIELVRKLTNDMPVLLLDDVLSELDKDRQTYLLESISGLQTLITCTGLDDFVNSRYKINKIFHVEKGKVRGDNLGGIT